MSARPMGPEGSRARVLVLADYYLPGVKAGGPIQSLSGLIEQLGDEWSFWVVTRDRDWGDKKAYGGVRAEKWSRVGKAMVKYVMPSRMSRSLLMGALKDSRARALYINSFFSPRFSMWPVLLMHVGAVTTVPVILAPRGEFSEGALQLKSLKKRSYLLLTRAVGLYRNVIWHASSALESEDIRREFGSTARIVIAENMSPRPELAISFSRGRKEAGRLKLVFVSRVCRKKNLDGALKMLRTVQGRVTFNIFGPIEDQGYWEECLRVIESQPANVTVQYKGTLRHPEVQEIFAGHDLFLFPTLGENFGHVILEALAAGCPVMVSDRTPWRGLGHAGVGWDLSLNQPELFQRAIAEMVAMGPERFEEMSLRAAEYARSRRNDPAPSARHRELFRAVVEQTGFARSPTEAVDESGR